MLNPETRSFAPKIDPGDDASVAYWAERLQISPDELVQVVAEVGDNPKAVATELGVALID